MVGVPGSIPGLRTIATRSVPEHRIKTLTCYIDSVDNDAWAARRLAEQMADEIVAKLFQFNKIGKEQCPAKVRTRYTARIDVIVPELGSSSIG